MMCLISIYKERSSNGFNDEVITKIVLDSPNAVRCERKRFKEEIEISSIKTFVIVEHY